MIIFRKPPGPTVLVTTAHCTFLCKNDTTIVDNCCCNNVGNIDCSDDVERCGNNSSIVEMTGTLVKNYSHALLITLAAIPTQMHHKHCWVRFLPAPSM